VRKVAEKQNQKRALHCAWSCPFNSTILNINSELFWRLAKAKIVKLSGPSPLNRGFHPTSSRWEGYNRPRPQLGYWGSCIHGN
jgi:hypothetical protein